MLYWKWRCAIFLCPKFWSHQKSWKYHKHSKNMSCCQHKQKNEVVHQWNITTSGRFPILCCLEIQKHLMQYWKWRCAIYFCVQSFDHIKNHEKYHEYIKNMSCCQPMQKIYTSCIIIVSHLLTINAAQYCWPLMWTININHEFCPFMWTINADH